jgi:hypothetical protein
MMKRMFGLPGLAIGDAAEAGMSVPQMMAQRQVINLGVFIKFTAQQLSAKPL